MSTKPQLTKIPEKTRVAHNTDTKQKPLSKNIQKSANKTAVKYKLIVSFSTKSERTDNNVG